MYARIKRALYPENRPSLIARILNRGWAWVHASGIAPNWLLTLEVVGRKSGKLISLPVVVALVNGERYLVSMLGNEAQWVLNVHAAQGTAWIRAGKRYEVRMEEISVERRPPILKAYLMVAPGARPHIPISKDAPVEDFVPIAAKFPVFRIVRV
jgi:hypothetical protein